MTNIANSLGIVIDDFDRRILNIVQRNNLLTHADIGERVGLSASAVRRRLAALRDNNVIEKDVAILTQRDAGVRLIVTVTFEKESIDAYEAFDKQVMQTPEILQCYHVSGTEDYVLIVQGPSLEWYEAWGKKAFMKNDAIRRYDTSVVWSCKKFETAIPL